MMRSLYAGVSGLKTHQTKMDVIGNNIANVNTVAYKSSSITFSEMMYQTTQSASGANSETGRGGVNARQIGLGVQTGAISTNIGLQGGSQSTGNPLDMSISGDSFFVVSDGVNNYFTRDGSFGTDGAGNLVMGSNGYTVMGWGVDPGTNEIKKDTVSAIQIFNENNLTYPAEATSKGYVSGIIDKNDPSVNSEAGKIMNLAIYDNLGYAYTAKFSVHAATEAGEFYVELDDLIDSEGKSVKDTYDVGDLSDIVSFGKETLMKSDEVRSLMSGVSYDSDAVAPASMYKKDMTFSDVFSDYDSKKISGLTYTYDNTNSTTTNVNDEKTFTGTGTLNQKDLEAKEIFWVEEEKAYYDMSDPAKPEGIKLSTNKEWNAALDLKLTGADADVPAVDENGVLTIEVSQTFKVGKAATAILGTDGKPTGAFVGDITQAEAYGLEDKPGIVYAYGNTSPDGKVKITTTETINGNILKYDTDSGKFVSIGDPARDEAVLDFKASAVDKTGKTVSLGHFSDIEIDFAASTSEDNKGVSTAGATNGDIDNPGMGTGRRVGAMSGISTSPNGMIHASYDNGQIRLLGQIAVAEFSNAAGLEKAGNNLYSATMNSGDFDGIGVDVTAGGAGKILSSVLEMSNVDLSQEFTDMITTQRGFQANSRIITTSDSLLEELVNLKR